MYKKSVLHKNEMNEKTTKFLDKFVKRVKAYPPGVCPIAVQLSFLQSSRSQTCGKCVPCRDGLEQVENMMRAILDGKADMDTFENMVELAKMIQDTADCAIGYEAANIVLQSVELFHDEYMSHIRDHRCKEDIGQKVPCISYCPANVDIPGYIALIGEERYADAINLIRRDNPFPTACAFICEHPCEEKCRRDLLDSPVNIRGLKKFAVDQIAVDKVKVPECNVTTGKRVAVVGGGNVAMDCARSAIRCNAKEVTVIYRRRQIDMTALPSEIQGAIEEGGELLTLNAPVRITPDENGNVKGFVCQPQIISKYDRQGKPGVTVANKEEIEVPCEIVLMAIGQDIVSQPFEKYGVNPKRKTFETHQDTRVKGYEKVFAGGDCVFGPATVIKAIGAGKIAALNIDEYLGYHHKYLEDIHIPEPRENDRTHYGRVHLTDRSARERKHNFEPVENGMSYDEAMQECHKCLRCDHFGCGVVEGGKI